jgi:hypothetical protein
VIPRDRPDFRREDRQHVDMGHRRRKPARVSTAATRARAEDRSGTASRDHMARVHVDDETWAAFKQDAGPVPISEVLGQLVAGHVEREAAHRLRDGSVDDRQLLDALVQARELHQDVAAIVVRLERRLDERAALAQAVDAGQ